MYVLSSHTGTLDHERIPLHY